jgi:hypothetical protein
MMWFFAAILLPFLCHHHGGLTEARRSITRTSRQFEGQCEPTLTGGSVHDDHDGNHITICTDNKYIGDRFYIDVEFDANPAPDGIQWILQERNGRNIKLYDYDHYKEYHSLDLQSDVSVLQLSILDICQKISFILIHHIIFFIE